MTSNRRYQRAYERANKIHNPVLTKLLLEAVARLHAMEEVTIEETQVEIENIQMHWRRYCNDYARYKKGLAPSPDAFVENLVRMVRV